MHQKAFSRWALHRPAEGAYNVSTDPLDLRGHKGGEWRGEGKTEKGR